jgi:hypothetical protein
MDFVLNARKKFEIMNSIPNQDNIQNARSQAKQVRRDGANKSLWQTNVSARPARKPLEKVDLGQVTAQ